MTNNEKIKEFSGLIHKSGKNLLNIIEDIFDLVLLEQSGVIIREDELYIRDIYLGLKRYMKEVLTQSNKGNDIELDFRIDSRIVDEKIIADNSKLMQVMTNIINNAVKYTDRGQIVLSMNRVEDRLSISVKDTGIGVPDDKKDIVFDVFRQVDDSHTREYDGIGIGLAIANKIAHLLSGEILLDSQQNMGSEFTFSFPIQVINDLEERSSDEYLSSEVPDLSSLKVLVVEDDLIGMEFIINILGDTQCEIVKACNGKEAVELVDDDIDVVLMDLKMPVLNGFEATSIIRQSYPSLPVFALTAYTFQKEKDRALDAGCNRIISKPVKKELLYEMLGSVLRS